MPKLELDLNEKISSNNQLKIHSIRNVGIKDARLKDAIFLPPQIKTKNPFNKTQLLKGKSALIKFSDLKPTTPENQIRKSLLPEPAIKSLSLNKNTVRKFLQETNQNQSSGEYEKALGSSNVLVKLDVPEGVPEDELNKYEQVFYSFRKRTALNYINSFYKELNHFTTTNPHLKFPVSEKEERLTGRVTYDGNGNIVKIKMLRWSDDQKTQDFFLEVLKDMSALPNPPQVIIKDGEFHVYYSLTLNGRYY